jgi:phosphoribosylaminoimidazolecarboxamide formyltransferase / IMP cyclohydrolase
VSAFGSIIAVNREVSLAFVEQIGKLFLEVLVAPAFSAAALEWLGRRKKNCRVMRANAAVVTRPVSLRTVHGGVVAQSADTAPEQEEQWRVVTKAQPSDAQMRELSFAWRACKHVKSNAILICRGTATVGVGCGQPNRVEAVGLAASRAGSQAKGSVLASDAFFPFADGLRAAASAGSCAVIQPGGSIRDSEVIQAADELGIVMVCTGRRHFKH